MKMPKKKDQFSSLATYFKFGILAGHLILIYGVTYNAHD